MEEEKIREYYLTDILAAKHYPQVLRITRPYLVEGRELLRKGQYITVLDRKRIELLTGVDKEKRPFKVRNDRSAIVEVFAEDRIAHSLAEVASVSTHIQGIEICKELRIDKRTFNVGERLTIEKIGKSFRGRMKNINLKRERDGKVYRMPLDVIGSFRLIAGQAKITKLINLRWLPVSAQFRNTPTSSNFPSGIVTVKEMSLCDIVYILTVQEGTYTYEAFSIESNVYVEKCNLKLPKPILKLVPDGVYVTSSDFASHKQKYREKLHDIDSKLIENIYAPGYYGSATYEKNPLADDHLDNLRKRISSTLSLDESYDSAMRTLSEYSSNPSTPDSEISASFPSKKPPEVLPRHSKNRLKEKRSTMTAIHEFDWSPQTLVHKSASDSNIVGDSCNDAGTSTIPRYHRMSSTASGEFLDADTVSLDLPSNVGSGSNRSNASNRSRLSDRYEGHPSKIYAPLDDHEIYYQAQTQHKDRLVNRVYESPNGPTRLQSRTSSVVVEGSGDSGVFLDMHTPRPAVPGKSPTSEDEHFYTYTTPPQHELNTAPNARRMVQPSPLPLNQHILPSSQHAQHSRPQHGDENMHKVHVDIDISNDSNNNSLSSINSQSVYSQSQTSAPPLKPREPTNVEHRPDDYVNSNFVSDVVRKRVNEIRGLTQDQTGVLLKGLNLARYVPIFNSELINGDLLLEVEEVTLVRDLGMTHFDARKLYKYVHGWRPILSYADDTDVESEPGHWSVKTVVNALLKIKLPVLARFSRDNHVDGSMLVEMVKGNLIETLKPEHSIALSGIELSRLRAFVLKKWRPDSAQPENTRRISQQERSFRTTRSSSSSMQNINTVDRNQMMSQNEQISRSNISLNQTSMAPQDRERMNSDEKKKSSIWSRIKAV